jgi:hypothetical protein
MHCPASRSTGIALVESLSISSNKTKLIYHKAHKEHKGRIWKTPKWNLINLGAATLHRKRVNGKVLMY